MKTNNPFIAAACDQAGEVCELIATAEADAAFSQHASDSKELRRLCQERDDLRQAIGFHKVDIAELESLVGHVSTLVDELRRLLGSAMQTMCELHVSSAPTPTLPATTVAEGAQLDGESLDPSE